MIGALVPPLALAVGLDPVGRVDRQLAEEDPADPRPWVDMAVRDAAGREVDAVAAEDPLAWPRIAGQLPDDGRSLDPRRSRVRRVLRHVVDDPIARLGLDALGVL